MKEDFTSQKGSTLVELVMVMMLLLLFGVAICTLVIAGSETQQKILAQKDAETDARIAMSYVNVRLRQNDFAGRISVVKNDIDGSDSILLQQRGSLDEDNDIWIFFTPGENGEPGVLRECWCPADEPPTILNSYDITNIDGFEVAMDESGRVSVKIMYQYDGQPAELSSVTFLRSFDGGVD